MRTPNIKINGGRRGDRLQDGKAHLADHGRRNFMRNLGVVGTAGFMLNSLPVNSLGATPFTAALTDGDDERILVMIRLKGGNDGLNTIIPVADHSLYRTARPDLAIALNDTVQLTPDLNLHPQLAPLQRLWNEGEMHVVQNVGYPEQNLSHFRSSDIWATTSDADEVITSGVLGRYLNDEFPDFLSNPPEVPPAIQIGGQGNLLFNNPDDFNYAISTRNPTQLYNIARTGQLYDVANVPDCGYGEQLGYLRAVANTTFRYAGVLAQAFDAGANDANGYLDDRLGQQLALVARLIKGGLRTRFYVVELDGFDTHANQAADHARLLSSVANNTDAFFSDLTVGDHADRVLAMTFSEFGRRINQNGSMGTDHGASAPLMIFGSGLNGNGLTGGQPDLQTVDDNFNMVYQRDFRDVYATVLSRWLCIADDVVDGIMGASFERMDSLGLACQGSPNAVNERARQLALKAYLAGGEVVLEYDLPAAGEVRVHCFDVSGRKVATPFDGRRGGGAQVQRLRLESSGMASGIYVIALEYGGRMYSRKLGIFR